MIVNTSVKYNSNILKSDINSLMLHYPFINLITIGYSVLEKPIYCIKLGNGPKEVFYFGAIHANEWITCNLLMKFIEELCNAYAKILILLAIILEISLKMLLFILFLCQIQMVWI